MGEPNRRDPAEERGEPANGTVGEKHGENTGSRNRVNETAADSGTGEASRFGRALHRIGDWCRNNRHLPLAVQQNRLSQKLRGHYGYFGITGNAPALGRFFYETRRVWRYWLDRRSQRAKMAWPRFLKLLERYSLPQPVVVHSVYRDAAKP